MRCGINRYAERLKTGSGKGDDSRLEEIGVEEGLCELLQDAWLRKRGEGIFKVWQLLSDRLKETALDLIG